MKKILICAFISLTSIHAIPDQIKTFESGTLHKKNKLHILKLHGSWRDMGRQYGILAKDLIADSVDRLIYDTFVRSHLITEDEMIQKGNECFDLFSGRLQQLLYGMEETSNIDHNILAALCNFWWLCLHNKYHVFGCTSMIAWGNYTQDGNTIFAHNFDYRPFYRNFNDLNVLVAYHPNDGSNSLITMCQAGQITAPIFWITKELAASANDGSSNGGDNIVANRIAWPFTLFEHLLDAQNLRAYEHRINSSNTNFSCIPYAADKARGIAFDWSVYGSKKRPETTPNLHIMINDFTHPDWNFIKAVDDPATLDFAKRRRAMNNLITRFAPFNIQDYKDLFSTPMIESYNSPGVTVSKKLSNKPSVTLIQCITTPGRDDLWLRMPEYIDEWQHIDLKWLLN